MQTPLILRVTEERWQWRALACPARFTQYIRWCFLPLYSFVVQGAAGHNRWGAAERQPLEKTQGRDMDLFNVRV